MWVLDALDVSRQPDNRSIHIMPYNVSTKPYKDGAAITTKLTIDFTGASEDILREIATSAIVIKWQGQVRKNGIPQEATIKAVDYRPGTRLTTAPTMDQLVSLMTPEQKQALLAKLLETETKPE